MFLLWCCQLISKHSRKNCMTKIILAVLSWQLHIVHSDLIMHPLTNLICCYHLFTCFMFCNLHDCIAYVLLIQPHGCQNSINMIWPDCLQLHSYGTSKICAAFFWNILYVHHCSRASYHLVRMVETTTQLYTLENPLLSPSLQADFFQQCKLEYSVNHARDLKDHRQRISRFVIRRYLEKSIQKKLFAIYNHYK